MTDPVPQKNRPLIDLSALCNREKELFDALSESQQAQFLGFGPGRRPTFDVPDYDQLPWEKVLKKGNAFVVLGCDRNGGPTSGFGGQMATHCGAVDIVAGRNGFYAAKKTKARCKIEKKGPDFVGDAARVYVSQRADPDAYFRIAPGVVGNTSFNSPRSTVVAKADTIRIIARENIKLVTKTDNMNSQGATLRDGMKAIYGIDLMAMNGAGGQQSLVKGQQLVKLLIDIVEGISGLQSTFLTYVAQTRKFHMSLVTHNHHGSFFGIPDAPDFKGAIPDGVMAMINNVCNVDVGLLMSQVGWTGLKFEYLHAAGGIKTTERDEYTGEVGTKYILSDYNTTN
jgi:hypothetical protein